MVHELYEKGIHFRRQIGVMPYKDHRACYNNIYANHLESQTEPTHLKCTDNLELVKEWDEEVSSTGDGEEKGHDQPPEHRVVVVDFRGVAQQGQGRHEGHHQGHGHGKHAHILSTQQELLGGVAVPIPDGVEDSDAGRDEKREDKQHVVRSAEMFHHSRVDAVVLSHLGGV